MLHTVEVLHCGCGDTRVSNVVFTAGRDVAKNVHLPRSINYHLSSQRSGGFGVREGVRPTGSYSTNHICLKSLIVGFASLGHY